MVELPLTPTQRPAWFLEKFDPGSPNNVTYNTRVSGYVDPEILAGAFRAVMRRHEALRAVFLERDGVPVQVITEPFDYPVDIFDFTAEPVETREERARQAALGLYHTVFDLSAGPLMRVALLKLADDDHVMIFVVHHLVSDGTSRQIIQQDLTTAYAALHAGRAPQFAPAAVTWTDWVREQATPDPQRLARDLAYWRQALAEVPTLALPTDFPRPQFKAFRADMERLDLDAETSARLDELARTHRCSLFMVLLAAFQVLLARHCEQDDICVGTAIAGRHGPEFDSLVGLLATALPLRGDLSGDPSFRELLERTRSAALDAYTHQGLPLDTLLGELGMARDLSRTPLFQTMLVLHSQRATSAELVPGVPSQAFRVGVTQSPHDLTVDAWPSPDGRLVLTLTYDTALFEPSTARTLLERYTVLLRAVVSNVDARCTELPIDGALSRQQVLGYGRGPQRDFVETVLPLFEMNVEVDPDAPAVGSYTYGQLDVRANRIARHLRERGVTPGSVVGVCLPRTGDLVATLLAIWRCGAAYLPLDPTLPAARMRWLCTDAGVRLMVTAAEAEMVLNAALGVDAPMWTVVSLDGEAIHIEVQPGDAMVGAPGPESLAYVLYTSGSTGQPKGVGVSHGALGNLLLSMWDILGGEATDVWLGLTSLSFDISGLELFLPLVLGARLELVPDELATDGQAVTRIIRERGVTHVQATPSGWRVLLDGGFGTDQPPTVTALSCGEALPPALAAQLRSRVRRLFNAYGPTETTIYSSANELPDPIEAVSIEGPLANTQLYVVDRQMRLVPSGVPGELLIGGAGLAWGYVGRPGLTADRFVPDPFGPAGTRLYRTGDRARWRTDGRLELLGRSDHQVKVRGHRIELSEIEMQLAEHPDVGLAAVVVAGEAEHAQLAGYVTAAPGAVVDPAALLAFLRERLPAIMVPAQMAVLEQMPRNLAGKVDRKRLPAIVVAEPGSGEFIAPRTEVEQTIAAIWSEVLGRDRISVTDNFFAIGGHSLLANRVVARLTAAIELELPVRTFFLNPTIEAFANAVEEALVADVALLSDDEVAFILANGTAS